MGAVVAAAVNCTARELMRPLWPPSPLTAQWELLLIYTGAFGGSVLAHQWWVSLSEVGQGTQCHLTVSLIKGRLV